MNSTKPSTCKHSEHELRDHGHVKRNPIALLYAVGLKHLRGRGDVVEDLLEGVGLALPGIALPSDGRAVSKASCNVPVEGVHSDLQGGGGSNETTKRREGGIDESQQANPAKRTFQTHVPTHVELSAFEPLDLGRIELPFHDLVPALVPLKLLGDGSPETGGILEGLPIHVEVAVRRLDSCCIFGGEEVR
jgi:hypothetical protein